MLRLYLFISLPLALSLGSIRLEAREYALSSNVLGYADMLTLNAEASMSMSRHWSIGAGALYNPFRFKAGKEGRDINRRQRTFYGGARFWPWHVYSGWWFYGKIQYQEYNFGGLFKPETKEGDRYGAGISFGYTYMLTPFLNIEFGAGFWSGMDIYKVYSCQVCGMTEKSGKKIFILPDNILLALSFVF